MRCAKQREHLMENSSCANCARVFLDGDRIVRVESGLSWIGVQTQKAVDNVVKHYHENECYGIVLTVEPEEDGMVL